MEIVIHRPNVICNHKVKYVVLGAVALLLGLVIYLLFRPNTYISRFILKFLPLDLSEILTMINTPFFKFYMGDYLWAFSLSCWLRFIFNDRSKNALSVAIVAIAGALYEMMQYFGIISGTGDILDCLLYLLAGLTVSRLK